MGYAEDSDYKPKPAKTALVGKTNAKQAQFYKQQRMTAEAAEKRGGKGSDAATRTAAQIHQKLGRSLTGREADLTQKPGASEDEQRAAVFGALGGAGDAAALLGGLGRSALRSSVPQAVEGAVRKVGSQVAKRTIPGAGPRVVGKATVEDVGRTASRRALGPGKQVEKSAAKRGASKAPDLDKTAKGTPRKVNPRAAGTHPRAMGTNPRAVAARRAAEKAATGKKSVGKKAADIIRAKKR